MTELVDRPVAASTAVDAAPRPWGIWASLAWVIAAEVIRRVVRYGLDHLPFLAQGGLLLHAVRIILLWSVPMIVLIVAVRLTRVPLRDYFAWVRPRIGMAIVGVIIVLAPELIWRGLAYLATGSMQFPVDDYHAKIAAGMSPWWYVLGGWPAFLLAPFVEESTYRGFLWRGLAASRIGNWGALLLTSLFFASVHYRYYLHDGIFDVPAFISPLVIGLLLGWVRWRSGSTIASMIAHSASNLSLSVGTLIAATI